MALSPSADTQVPDSIGPSQIVHPLPFNDMIYMSLVFHLRHRRRVSLCEDRSSFESNLEKLLGFVVRPRHGQPRLQKRPRVVPHSYPPRCHPYYELTIFSRALSCPSHCSFLPFAFEQAELHLLQGRFSNSLLHGRGNCARDDANLAIRTSRLPYMVHGAPLVTLRLPELVVLVVKLTLYEVW